MPFLMEDAEVARVLDLDVCLESARRVFRHQARGEVLLTEPRVERLLFPSEGTPAGYRVKGAAFPILGIAGVRIARSVLLTTYPGMDLLGMVEESTAYARRVGAVTAAALEPLGREEFPTVALFGAGKLARTTLDALLHRYRIGSLWVLSRTRASRNRFARDYAARGFDVRPTADIEAAVANASLTITMTDADEPLFRSEWVPRDAVVVSMGGGQEVHPDLLDRAGQVFVDDLEGCLESGDLAAAGAMGRYRPEMVTGHLFELFDRPETFSPSDGPTILIPRGMAAMDVMQAIRAAEIAGHLPRS